MHDKVYKTLIRSSNKLKLKDSLQYYDAKINYINYWCGKNKWKNTIQIWRQKCL